MSKKYISFVLAFLLTSVQLFAQKGIPERPSPPRLVNNLSKQFPNFISPAEEAQLEQKLVDFANQTSNQIVIVIVDNLSDLEPAEYAYELGDKWKVGQEKEDNGIVILIKPTGGQGDRKYFIATGKGLEGAIPDATTRKIENQELVPNFKDGKYYEGLDATTSVLMSLAKGEYNSAQYAKKSSKGGILQIVLVIFFIIIFIAFGFRRRGGGGGRGGMTMGSRGIWLGGLGAFGAGRSSGGGFGGGSSGGFGGFGGGSFGGGGSGGSW